MLPNSTQPNLLLVELILLKSSELERGVSALASFAEAVEAVVRFENAHECKVQDLGQEGEHCVDVANDWVLKDKLNDPDQLIFLL